jgi:hypothetical protein
VLEKNGFTSANVGTDVERTDTSSHAKHARCHRTFEWTVAHDDISAQTADNVTLPGNQSLH